MVIVIKPEQSKIKIHATHAITTTTSITVRKSKSTANSIREYYEIQN
jgi:hypothetical protein